MVAVTTRQFYLGKMSQMFKSKNLPPVGEVAALMPEELAPLILRDLTSLAQVERAYFNIRAYCGHFDTDIHGPMRSHTDRVATRNALLEAWNYLERLGLIAVDIDQSSSDNFFVTRRGHEAAQSVEAYRRAVQRAHFPATTFHPGLRGATYDAFVRGNFQQAVNEAFRVIEVRVRDASGLASSGVPLMREAFHEDKGPLRSSSTDSGERQALAHLFAGAFGCVRNPGIHRALPGDDVSQAVEQLMLASLLLRLVDDRVAAKAVASS